MQCVNGSASQTSWTDQLDGSAGRTSWTDQFFLLEALASSHIRRFSFQFVHCRSFRVRRRPCYFVNRCILLIIFQEKVPDSFMISIVEIPKNTPETFSGWISVWGNVSFETQKLISWIPIINIPSIIIIPIIIPPTNIFIFNIIRIRITGSKVCNTG